MSLVETLTKIDVFFLSSESSGKSKALISAAGTDRQTQRYKMSAIIQASHPSTCPFSGEKIKPGDAICQYTIGQHKAYVAKEGKKMIALRRLLIGRWGKREHVDYQAPTTRYGRRIKTPALEGTRRFVKGSWIKNPDQFDRSYWRGVCLESDSEDTDPAGTGTDTEDSFVVKDVDSCASSEEEYTETSEEELSDEEEDESDEEGDNDDYEEEDSDEETSDQGSDVEEEATEEEDDGEISDVSSLTDYERPFKWAWEEDEELHKPDAERDDMFYDVEPSEELLHSGEAFNWEDDEGNGFSTFGGVRDVKLRNGDVFTVIDETDLVLDEYRMPVGQLYMDHLGVYNIHTGEGPCDG